MGLFSQITFNSPLSTNDASDYLFSSSGKYDLNTTRYPIDIGKSYSGHYMIFHINVQEETKFSSGTNSQSSPNTAKSLQSYGSGSNIIKDAVDTISGTVKNSLDTLDPSRKELVNDIASGLSRSTGISDLNFNRTVRTGQTICLYMPDTLVFADSQDYTATSLNNKFTKGLAIGSNVVSSIKDFIKNEGDPKGLIEKLGPNLSPFALSALGGNTLTAGLLGVVSNPLLEVIYSSPQFRTFRFDFMFNPRSQQESAQVLDIIYKFRFHQAPEVAQQGSGFFLRPPSSFDIQFMYNGKENPNIPKISTCVLTNIDVDYAPNGFSSYEVPGQVTPSKGGTGMPVSIRLSLGFTETQIMNKGIISQMKNPSTAGSSSGSSTVDEFGGISSPYLGGGGDPNSPVDFT